MPVKRNINQNWNDQIGGNYYGFGGIPSTGMGNQFANARGLMTSNNAYRGLFPGSDYSPHRGFEEMQFSERVQPPEKKEFRLPGIFGTIAAGFDATNPKAFNYNPHLRGEIDFMQDQGMYGVDQKSGLNKITSGALANKNLQSMFGSNSLEAMYAKELERAQKVEAGLSDQWSTLAASTDEADIARWKAKQTFHRNKVAQIKKEQAAAAAAQQKAADVAMATQRQRTRAGDKAAGAFRDTVQLDPRGGGGPGGGTWRGQTAAKERQGVQVAGPGFGKGAYFNQGGRAGYQGGELVEQETDFMQGPHGGEEFQETVVEGEEQPSREQLEALAMEIFQLPLEELDDQQLLVVYQEAMQGQPMEEAVQEEDVQFAANGGRMGYLFGGDIEQQTDFLEGPQDNLMASSPSTEDG